MILESVGAKITIASGVGKTETLKLDDYLYCDMNQKIILNVTLPHLDASKFIYRSYKVSN